MAGKINLGLPEHTANEAFPEMARDDTAARERRFADGFVKFTQKNDKNNAANVAQSMGDLLSDYRRQGLSPEEIKSKMADIMSVAYDMGIEQGVDADHLKQTIKQFERRFNATLDGSEHAAEQPAVKEATRLDDKANAGAKLGLENVKDAEYEDVTNDPAYMNAENASADRGNSAPENVKSDSGDAEYVDYEDAPSVAEAVEAEENTADAKVDDEYADEGNESKAAAVNVNDGYDNDGNGVVPPAGNGNDGNADGLADGGFTMSVDDGNSNANANAAGNANADAADKAARTSGKADSGDLLAQMMDTAFKNRYMMVEDVNNDPNHLCPFGQLKSNTVKDESDDKDDPRVSMQLNTGATLVNRPNRVHIKYTTKVDYDEGGNEIRSPQVSFEDCMAAVRLGMEKGWTSATLNGPDAYKEQMYLAMRAMGMKVVGYQPSAELQKQGDELAAQYVADRRHADFTDQRYPAISAQCKADGLSKPEKIGESFVNKMNDMDGMRYDPAEEEVKLTKDGNYTVTTQQNDGEGNTVKTTVTYGFGGRVVSNASDGNEGTENSEAENTSAGNAGAENGGTENTGTENTDTENAGAENVEDENAGNETVEQPQPINLNDEETSHVEPTAENVGNETVEQPQPINLNDEETPHIEPTAENQAETTVLPATIDKESGTHSVETPNLPATIDKGGNTNEAPEQVPPVKGAENNLPVPVTAKVRAQLAIEAGGATTALAKTDPVMARQMATQVAATKGIANRLRVVGQIANRAKGNNTQLALTQHHQQETAIARASQKDKTK